MGDNVTFIGDMAFEGCENLKSICIPNGVTSIGSRTFKYCNSLISVTIGDSVTSIGESAFGECASLTSVNIPDALVSIGEGAFSGCSSLTSITMPNNIETIGDYVFSGCSSLTSITMPNNIETIGDFVFSGCSSLDSITIPENVKSLGACAFGGCSALTSVTIPSSVDSIGSSAFGGCSSLTKAEFASIESLCNIKFSENCSNPLYYAHHLYVNGEEITNVAIPSTVTIIGNNTFSGGSSLVSIIIPENVVSIGEGAFEGCSSLPSITIPNNLTSISSSVFSGCSILDSITIPDNITSIGSYAFANCSSLASIIIPHSVNYIGNDAFKGTPWLENQNDGVIYICNIAYTYKGKMPKDTSIIIEDGTKGIASGAFRGYYNLSSITIPNSVSYIGSYAFSGSGLTSITIPSSVTSIGDGVFYWCTSLKSINIPNSVTYIGNNAFENCNSLKDLTLPNSLTTIGAYAFWECDGLESIHLPEHLTYIGGDAFRDCESLTSISIPNSVNYIGYSAFSGCENLTSIKSYIQNPFDIDDLTFYCYYSSYVIPENFKVYDNAILYVPLGTTQQYKATKGWKRFVNIEEFFAGNTLSLMVIDSNGNDVSNQVSIVWYDAEGKQIGTGRRLGGVIAGSVLYYSVFLNEGLGRIYHEVSQRKIIVGDGSTTSITCQLEHIDQLTLYGRVSATDIDKSAADVNVRQMLNGKYEETFTALTNEKGVFSITVFDDETDITISREDCIDATLHRESLNGNGNLGTIPLNLITGHVIAANVVYHPAIAIGESAQEINWVDNLNNIEFTLTNETTGEQIDDIAIQSGKVIIKSGADVGDEIRVEAKSKQGVFADATTTFTIIEGANAITLELIELGGLDAVFESSNNGSTSGYLYNSNGMLVARGSYTGETLSLRHLPSGSYTLVSMGSSLLLGNITRLSDLASIGLSEGSDYVENRIEVVNGELTVVTVNEVPMIVETQFYYTTGNTYFIANKTSIMAGNYLTLQAHIDFKAEHSNKVDGVTLIVDLPDGCQMVENSVIANSQGVAYVVNGNRVAITLNKEQYQSRVRFCVIPTLNQNYTITAIALFDMDGQVQQPIGTAQFEAKGLSLIAPKLTADTLVTINGIAKGYNDINIYDNDVFVGKTSSKADGSWTVECELFKPYSNSYHDIFARIITDNGQELTSETQQIYYDKNNPVPEKVTMLYYNPEFEEQPNIVFDLINGTTTPSSYYYFPYKNWPNWYETFETEPKDFTFLANFTRNDTTLIKNVNIKVLNSDGTIRTLPATFDAQQDAWVATTKYSNKLPRNAIVDYDVIISDVPFNPSRINDDNNQYINLLQNYVTNIDTTKVKVLSSDETMMVCQYQTLTMNEPLYMRIEILDYDSHIGDLENTDFFTFDKDGVTTYVCDSVLSETHHIDWIWTKENKHLLQIEVSDNNDFSTVDYGRESHQMHAPAIFGNIGRILGRSLLNMFCNAGDIMDIINEYNSGYDELQYWIRQYKITTDNQMKLYNVTKKMIEEKCPDGSLRLSATAYNNAIQYLNQYFNEANEMRRQFDSNLDRLERDLVRRRDASSMFSATMSLWSAAGAVGGVATSLRGFVTDFFRDAGQGTVIESVWEWMLRNEFYTADQLSDWYYSANSDIIRKYSNLQTITKNAYKKCDKKEEEEEEEYNDDSNENKPDFPSNGTTPLIDPSGFVYEAVLTNRLEGVTTTCYQQVNGEAVVWDAEDYSQHNPLVTDATGFYRWDVPQGMWQVKYEKEGYETVYSEWLPVPPPQLDVNIGMKQNTPPTVKQMRGTESGITIEMGKYMLPATMTTQNITVTRNGETEEGGIELLNVEQAPSSDEAFVSKVKFVPDNHFHTTDVVVVTVHKEVESYCGVPMTADHVETVKIERDITAVVVDSVVTIPYHGERELQVLVLPKDAAAGRTLHVRTSSPMIASVSEEDVSINENGVATLTIGGKLPGGAVVDFTVEGTDATATSKIKVVMDGDDLVAAPTASIASGNTVLQGTQVTLSCATEEATIYYTLDGTCPCDEQARQLYSGPITIIGDVTIKAIAVKKGMDDSDVATFIYLTFPVNVTAKSYTRQYGEANPMFEYAVSSGALQGTPEIVCEATKESPVGTYDIVIRQGSVANYNVVYVNGLLTIEKAPLTISAGTYTIKQGDPMPEFTLTYEGFKNNETTAVLTKMPVVSCDAVDSSAPGEYPITVSGAEATNYDVSYMTGKLIVTERPIYILMYVVDGEEYKRYSLQEGDAIIPEKEPIKEGYTFSGWSEIPETMPAHDVTVTGTFSINSYALTYMIDDKVYKQMMYEYGATIIPEPKPAGDYVSFEWVGEPETMPAQDVTVTAVYETGIAEIMMMVQQGQVRIYSPNGKKLDKLQKGLNIVVMQDGTTRKVVVK